MNRKIQDLLVDLAQQLQRQRRALTFARWRHEAMNAAAITAPAGGIERENYRRLISNRCTAWRPFPPTGCIALALVSLLFLSSTAFADDGHDHDKLGGVGDFYASWMRPGKLTRGGSCCNQNDCALTEIIKRDGKFYAHRHKMSPAHDVLIPDNLMEHNQGDPRESPDGQSHVCLDQSGGVLCAVLGSGQ